VALSDLCVLLVVINHGKSGRAKSEEFADFLNRVIGSNDPVFSRWAITTVWLQMAETRPSHRIKINDSYRKMHASNADQNLPMRWCSNFLNTDKSEITARQGPACGCPVALKVKPLS
jgi:hypothetical protein